MADPHQVILGKFYWAYHGSGGETGQAGKSQFECDPNRHETDRDAVLLAVMMVGSGRTSEGQMSVVLDAIMPFGAGKYRKCRWRASLQRCVVKEPSVKYRLKPAALIEWSANEGVGFRPV